MARGTPLTLMLEVLRHLQSSYAGSRGSTIEELARHCGVSTRTIRRKIQALQRAGFVIDEEVDEDRRKRFKVSLDELRLSHVIFEPFEAAALYVANGMMSAMSGLPLAEEARAALDKATQSVPPSFRRELNEVISSVRASLPSRHDYRPFVTHFTNLVDAVSERWTVEIDYRSLERPDKPRRHRVHPYLIHIHDGTVYLLARKPGEDRFLTFALERMEDVQVHDDEVFARDPSFDPERFVADSFNGFHGDEVVEVRVRFWPPAAQVIKERVWHHSQQIEEAGDGSVTLTFRTTGPEGVLHWAKSYLPHSRILAPQWLSERQRREARTWLDRLESDDEVRQSTKA